MTMKAMPKVTKMPRCLEGMLSENTVVTTGMQEPTPEPADQAERAKERVVRREGLGQRGQTIEHNRDGEHLLTADGVGHDASDGAAENHAEQAPSGQRAGKCGDGLASSDLLCKERRCNVSVGGINDHEVIAVEDHGECQEDEHDPRVAGNACAVDDLRYCELFTVHQYPLR